MGTPKHSLREEGTRASEEKEDLRGYRVKLSALQFHLGQTSVLLPGIYFFSKGLRDRCATAPIA